MKTIFIFCVNLIVLLFCSGARADGTQASDSNLPYVYPMVLAQFFRPIGGISDAQATLSKLQQGFNSAKQDLQAAQSDAQDAISTLAKVNQTNLAASVTQIAQD